MKQLSGAQPEQQAKPLSQKLKTCRRNSTRVLLDAAVFGGFVLGTATTIVWYGVTGDFDLRLGLLGTCGGIAVAVGTRACINQPVPSESLSLIAEALEEQACDAQAFAAQLNAHRQAAGDLQRDLAASRKETHSLKAELAVTNQQLREVSGLVRELLASQQQQPKQAPKPSSSPIVRDEWDSQGDYWNSNTEVSHAA